MILNTYELGRWLMREVHGIHIPRKSPRKALGGPPRNWRYRMWIRSLPCAVCGVEPSGEAAHTGQDGGLATKASDYSCVPLCPDCHRRGPHAYHVVGRPEFERRHGLDIGVLVRRLTGDWFRKWARRNA